MTHILFDNALLSAERYDFYIDHTKKTICAEAHNRHFEWRERHETEEACKQRFQQIIYILTGVMK